MFVFIQALLFAQYGIPLKHLGLDKYSEKLLVILSIDKERNGDPFAFLTPLHSFNSRFYLNKFGRNNLFHLYSKYLLVCCQQLEIILQFPLEHLHVLCCFIAFLKLFNQPLNCVSGLMILVIFFVQTLEYFSALAICILHHQQNGISFSLILKVSHY